MDLSSLTSLLPAQVTLASMIKFIGIAVAVLIIVCLIFRLIFGKNSPLNKAICAGIGVLCIYILTIIIYSLQIGGLERFLVPLPFVKFSGSYLYLMPLSSANYSEISGQILSMVILVLLYHVADGFIRERDDISALRWLFRRAICTIAAMAIHYLVSELTQDFLPELLRAYGPILLLVCLLSSFMLGFVSLILSLVLTVANPILCLLFTFFFRNKFGRQISKALLSASILTALVALLGHFGYDVILITPSALTSYIPLLAALMALWYIIGRKL